jgi:hypothetical protein
MEHLMSDFKSVADVLAEDEVGGNITERATHYAGLTLPQDPMDSDEFNSKWRDNTSAIENEFKKHKADFSFKDAEKSWGKERHFPFRKKTDFVLVEDDFYGAYNRQVDVFSPIVSNAIGTKIMHDSGFYSRYLSFKLDWNENDFYKTFFDDFFEQYVIAGESNYGYYIFGPKGVGKSTLLSAMAKVIAKYLRIEIRYVTMPRLVRLITSIAEDDKHTISELENCDVLFVDDFAHENYNTNNQESAVRDFFAYRYGNCLVNVIAGNNDIREIADKNSFFTQMADYINDSNYYKVLKINGKSRRM